MKTPFDTLSDGRQAYAYTITDGVICAKITDLGATILDLCVPGKDGMVDVALGFQTAAEYKKSTTFFGTVVGRSCNRTKSGRFTLNGKEYQMGINDGNNNLHCGPDFYKDRLWEVESVTENSLKLRLESPDGDQGFPGNATIQVTYTVKDRGLYITYDAICDTDTVFNLTNHCYFNLFGHNQPQKAMEQILMMPARHFTPDDAENIPTGELRSVEGTPMDFRTPKAIGRDIAMEYDALQLQNGYDHNFEVWCNPAAVLSAPETGITMEVITDRCGVQFYSGNFLIGEIGKDNVSYNFRGGICLETQFYPNALNVPNWQQPITKAGIPYHSETAYIFK